MKLFKRRQPVEMTEEERLAYEKYVKELNEKNQKTVKIVCTILWCLAMAAWTILLVLDVTHQVGKAKILFHGVAAAITALLAIPRVMDLFASKKKDDEDTEA
ncbi:MAG: hypothetical protein IKA50_03975 [Clostridia bacterium]|nr:hypothetical protein [Clostridia bacterium]